MREEDTQGSPPFSRGVRISHMATPKLWLLYVVLATGAFAAANARKIIDPCKKIKCPGSLVCVSTTGKAVCACPTGFTPSKKNPKACTKVDPCKTFKCPKGQLCHADIKGKPQCACAPGLVKDPIKGCAKPRNPTSNQGLSSGGGPGSCPPGSSPAVQAGVNACVCQDPSTHWVNGQCQPGALPHADFLDAHNKVRTFLGLKSLVWSDAVAQSAQNWADTLKVTPGCPMNHPDNIATTYPYGQNLARSNSILADGATPDYAVNLWVAEGAQYARATVANGCKTGSWEDCGHFTQLVWNDTTSVGCGKAQCPDDSVLWVCEYDPPGNWKDYFPFRRP